MTKAQLPSFTTFGEMLRYLRHRAHLTQMKLSIAAGYSESQISRLEQNERIPDKTTLLARFVPALGLEDQPETVDRLLELASVARIPRTVASLSVPHGDEDPLRTNLPPRLTSFVGREDAVATLRQLVATERLVTLTGVGGVGGVGKSSLSQVVGGDMLDSFADGVWLVELAALADASLLPQSVAAIFRLPEQHNRTALEVLMTYCRQKHMLLILDNCEHLIDACAQLVDQLRYACPQLHILATSRETLRVAGEVECPIPPLDAPHRKNSSDAIDAPTDTPIDTPIDAIGALQDYSAIRLFLDRARAVRPDFEWTDHTAPWAAQICAQLDGIPLAIELAAARLKAMTVNELAARLDDRFYLLSGGARSAPSRHQTLRAAIDWSYDLLSEPERSLLRRLSIFAGGWTLDAAEALPSRAASMTDLVDLLHQLVNKSLVVAEMRGAGTRYRLLETIRQYALEKLHEADEAKEMQVHHFAFFLRLAEQWTNVAPVGARFAAWLDQLETELDNLRAAYAWSQVSNDGGLRALQLAAALGPFWLSRGRFHEGQAWLEGALDRAVSAPPSVRARTLVGLGNLISLSALADQRIARAEEALRLCRQVDDRRGMAYSYLALARAAMDLSDFPRALDWFAQSDKLFRDQNWLPGVGLCLAFWARTLMQAGHSAQAISLAEECLAIGREIGDLYVYTDPLELLLQVDRQRGVALCRQELAYRRSQIDSATHTTRYELETLAALLETYGRRLSSSLDLHEVEGSIQALEESLSLWKRLGIQWSPAGGTARAYFDLGGTLPLIGEYDRAIACEQEAMRLYQEVGDTHGVAWALAYIGWPALCLDDFDLAKSSFSVSLELSPDGSMNCTPRALAGMAELARVQGDMTRAGRLYGAATHFEHRDEPLDDLPAYQAAPTYLDDPLFAAAWAEGETMTHTQAVAYALA